MRHSVQFGLLNLTSFVIFFVLKMRVLSRTIKDANILDFLAYSFQDMAVYFILTFILYQFLSKFRILAILIFFSTALNILFISKMGYPITTALINQLGDFVFIQTSIQSPSIYRNIMLLFSIFIFITFLFFTLETKFIQKIIPKKLVIYTNIFIIIASSLCFYTNRDNIDGRYSKNIFLSLIKPPQSVKDILTAHYFVDAKHKKWNRAQEQKYSAKKPYNIVLIIGETLSYQLDNGEDLNKIFPHLKKLEAESNIYRRHYTSWPYSSKSIFSIMCGNYPAPNSIIETRLNKPELCQSWNSRFIKEMNYDNYLAHTGTLQYDNMKSLFENIGYTNIYDKTNIDLNNRFKENDLSIDDLSMNFHFSNWLSNREKSSPFIASFITMNSHFPYWTPDKKFNISKNPYSNAMHYQDHFIGQVIKTLKQKKLYKNTIIIVTGDHGRRVSTSSQSIIPKSMYEVPLIIRLPQGAKREINYITNHAQIGGYLLEEVSGQPHGFTDMNLNIEKEHLIFFETDQIFYSLLSTEETSVLGPEGKIYSSSKGWPTFSSSKCDVKECPNNFNHYYTNLANLANWYDL